VFYLPIDRRGLVFNTSVTGVFGVIWIWAAVVARVSAKEQGGSGSTGISKRYGKETFKN